MSSMKGGFLLYKCRMCNEEYQDTHVPNTVMAIVAIANNFPCPWPQSSGQWSGLVGIHNHLDGSQGAADFIGVRQDLD